MIESRKLKISDLEDFQKVFEKIPSSRKFKLMVTDKTAAELKKLGVKIKLA